MSPSSRRRVSWMIRLVAFVAMSVLALAACGGSEDSGDDVSAAGDVQSTAPVVSDAPSDGAADEADTDTGVGAETDTDGSEAPPATTATEPPAATAPTEPPPVDDDRPRLDPSVLTGTVTAVDGSMFELGDLAGTDLVVWFWAPW